MSDRNRTGGDSQKRSGMPPHAATVVKPKTPHAATVAQSKRAFGVSAQRPPHSATVAQAKSVDAFREARASAQNLRHPSAQARSSGATSAFAPERDDVLDSLFAELSATTPALSRRHAGAPSRSFVAQRSSGDQSRGTEPPRKVDQHFDKMEGLVVKSPIWEGITSYIPKRWDVLMNPPKTFTNIPHAIAEMVNWSLYKVVTTKLQKKEDTDWVYQKYPLKTVIYDQLMKKFKWYNPFTWIEQTQKAIKYTREFEYDDVERAQTLTVEAIDSQSKKAAAQLALGLLVSQALRWTPKLSRIKSKPWLVKSFKGGAAFNLLLSVGLFLKQSEQIGKKMKELEESGGSGGKKLTALIRERRDYRIDPYYEWLNDYATRYEEFSRYNFQID